ncbi:MAG: hypothetical protein ACI4Q3_03590 [Kiritimatiellia bacterium]
MKTEAVLCLVLFGGCAGLAAAASACHRVVVPIRAGQSPQAYLEDVRAAGARARPADPRVRVVAGGIGADDAFAGAFIAAGESEEINAWIVVEPDPRRLKRLREQFDAAGGRAVELVDAQGNRLEPAVKRAVPRVEGTMPGPVFVAGSDRFYRLNPDASLDAVRPGCGNIHRVQIVRTPSGAFVYYSNGSLFRCRLDGSVPGPAELVYRPRNAVGGGVFGFEVQPAGNVVMALNSTDEVVEIEGGTRKEIVRFKVDPRNRKGENPGAHGHLRMIRKTPQGTYLVCCAGAATVREYSASGDLVWEQGVPVMAFDAFRRATGTTLVSHIDGISEYTPEHDVVWTFSPDEIRQTQLSCLCGIEELPNGNLLIGSWANGRPDASRATACEITRAKELVWAYYPSGDVNMMTLSR